MGRICNAESSNPSSSTSSSAVPQVTTSTSITETVNGTHKFKINGYSLSKGMGIGKYVASDTFMVGGYSWAIYFYPDGKSMEDNATYVSLFIALASEGTDVRALFELTLLDQSGKERHKVHSHFGRALESGPYTLKYRGSMWLVLLLCNLCGAIHLICFPLFYFILFFFVMLLWIDIRYLDPLIESMFNFFLI